ncbi:MAG: RluA family pseudouridine synthase [Syntrophorhabdaceae bacterium]|nr:RluA family pseudouridine synthase [Syntrophorhabdaceae bacterium]
MVDDEEKRLDVYLSEICSITRTRAKHLIEGDFITVDGKIPKPSIKVKKGMHIEGVIKEEETLSMEPQEIPLEILYEDEYILAINKPSDMVVHPSFGHSDKTLMNALLAYFNISCAEASPVPRAGIVHRLDKDTTGVILVAKDLKTQEMLSAMFKKRDITKHYRAVVEGIIKEDTMTIEGNIGRHPVERKKMAVLKKGGRDALTDVVVLERLNTFTYVDVFPKTGRTHQIRVHLSYKGHPIVGDEIYGKRARHASDRILLHAYRIDFVHPIKNIPLSIWAPVPDDIKGFIESHRG